MFPGGGASTSSECCDSRKYPSRADCALTPSLPIGAITVTVIFFYLKAYPSPAEADPNDNRPMVKRLLSLDWVGAVLMLGIVSCLVLALSWGGISKPWSSPSVITPLVVFGVFIPVSRGGAVLLELSLIVLAHAGPHCLGVVPRSQGSSSSATIPQQVKSVLDSVGNTLLNISLQDHDRSDPQRLLHLPLHALPHLLCVSATLSSVRWSLIRPFTDLPLQYQAVKHASATRSGIDILPYMMAVVFGAIISGALVQATGHYW